MLILSSHAQFFGLSKRDLQIVDALHTPQSVSALARTLKVPRTSIYTDLNRLHARKLVKRTTSGKRQTWIAISQDEFAARCESLLQGTHAGGENKQNVVVHQKTKAVSILQGIDSLIGLYEQILILKKHERLLILQPNQSTELVLGKFPYATMLKINRHIQKNKIIVEAVLHDNALKHAVVAMDEAGYSKKMVKEMLSAFVGRLARTTYVPQHFLQVKSELYIMNETAMLFNWEKAFAIRIQNADLVEMLKQLFAFVQNFGTRVDLNPKFAQLVAAL